jgi:hypothetical protein
VLSALGAEGVPTELRTSAEEVKKSATPGSDLSYTVSSRLGQNQKRFANGLTGRVIRRQG